MGNLKRNQLMTEPTFKVPNVKLHPEPSKITYHQLYNHRSRYDLRRAQLMKHYRGALPMFGGILGASLAYIFFFEYSHDYFYGSNGQGGRILDMTTSNSDYDMTYNREFQRMCYLAQVHLDTSEDISNETLS